MENLYKYRVWCTTENKWEYIWKEEGETPTTCPINTAHTVDLSKTALVESVLNTETVIQTESVKTGGNTQIQSFEVTVDSNTPNSGVYYDKVITFPIPINLIRGKWFNRAVYAGDHVQLLVAKNTPIGVITANIAVNDTIINVNSTVVENLQIGYYITIDGQDFGRVISIDTINSQITVENAATVAITATGTNYVLMTIKIVPHIYLEGTETMMTLEGGIGAQYLPTNTTITIRYFNNTGTAKKYSAIFEYFY